MNDFTKWVMSLIQEATDDVLRNAEKAMDFAKKNKIQADINKSQQRINDKKKQLGAISNKPIKPVKPS